MNGAPIVAALLRAALPDAPVLDLCFPVGGVAPWWPGARIGLVDVAAMPAAEAALLRRFRQGTAGWPVFGLDPVADAVPAAAFGSAEPPLLVLDAAPPPVLEPLLRQGAMLLRRGRTEGLPPPPGAPRGRIMLLAGSVAQIERWDLLLSPGMVGLAFERMQAAAQDLAAGLGGTGAWQLGGRVMRPDLASLGMLATGVAQLPPVALPAGALPHDLPGLVEADSLPLGEARRLRLLLGALPTPAAQLRLRLRGAVAETPPALFLDGERLEAPLQAEEEGQILEAVVQPRRDTANVIGLALPPGAPPGLALTGLEIVS